MPTTAESILAALRLHQAGDLATAEAIYRSVLAQDPNQFECLHYLGVIAQQTGRNDAAVELIGRALKLRPGSGEAQLHLANALAALGRSDEARRRYKRALTLIPRDPNAHYNYAGFLRAAERWDEATSHYRRAIALKPDWPGAHLALGNHLMAQDKYIEAVPCFERVLALEPDHAGAANNLGNALKALHRLDEAAEQYRRTVALKPDLVGVHLQLGNLLLGQGALDEAVTCFERILALQPDHVGARNNLANALKSLYRLDEAVAQYRQAIAEKPDYAEAHGNFGNAWRELGLIDEALACYERALALNPDLFVLRSSLLFCLNYLAESTPETLLAAHRQWDARHAPASARLPPRPRDPADGRRLRIGYLSPDLRTHSVAYFVAPLLAAHDRERFEIFCYADVARPDDTTVRLAAATEHWVSIHGIVDAAVIDRIRTDGIDILVDLAGHSGHNRLLLFGRKPAPVQMTWLGYPCTTGLSAIDFRITDWVADPAGAEAGYSEALLRLARCFVCYEPFAEAGPVAPPPSQRLGHVTFGSFNLLGKMTPPVTALWARLLRALPEAHLLLKASAFTSPSACARVLDEFAAQGVDRARIELVPWAASQRDHLALYDRVDIALDPFPYNGTTTTCEALWQGVPVVTLRGDRHAGRVGASLLGAAGLPELIAEALDDYVAIASALARDGDRLARWRAGLRERMGSSPLCDGRDFARALEEAYVTAWQGANPLVIP